VQAWEARLVDAISWKTLAFLVVVACLLVVPRSGPLARGGNTSHNEYALGLLDKVRVKVFEWRASRDELFEWSALNAEYAIGPEGKVSLPLVGELSAVGKTPGELASAIGAALKARIGLVEPPDVSVEVVQFRPFYILGDIEKPGEFAYRPGLTVLQAISIAGGMPRAGGLNTMRLERESISTRGDLGLFEMELMATLVRKARLTAELEGLDQIELPEELKGSREAAARMLMQQENSLFQSRKEAFAAQVRALEQLKSLHEREAEGLVKQLAAHDKHIELLHQELASVLQLYNQRLTTAPRKLALERNAAQLQGDRVRLETGLARAEQEGSKTGIALIELQNRRLNEITAELLKSQARLDELTQRISTSERLLFETEVIAPRYLKMRTSPKPVQPTYTIIRQISGQSIEVAATETTTVEPGDTLKIELPLPAQAQVETASTVREDRGLPDRTMPAWPKKSPPTLQGAGPGEMPIRY
jgi:polysaccharide export outer membrane protein/exopolysaccharide production protein ExoF